MSDLILHSFYLIDHCSFAYEMKRHYNGVFFIYRNNNDSGTKNKENNIQEQSEQEN